MSTADALTIAGGVLEAVGLLFVFYELIDVQTRSFGAPRWMQPIAAVLRRLGLLAEPKLYTVTATTREPFSILGQEPDRPPVTTVDERIARLEERADEVDQEMGVLRGHVDEEIRRVTIEMHRQVRELEQRREREDSEERKRVRASLRRQAVGAACIGVGLTLGTLGNLL